VSSLAAQRIWYGSPEYTVSTGSVSTAFPAGAGKAAGHAALGSGVDDVGDHCYTRSAVQEGVLPTRPQWHIASTGAEEA
jgi:hypothetical protein